MNRAQRRARYVRWFLLVLWVICFASAVSWYLWDVFFADASHVISVIYLFGPFGFWLSKVLKNQAPYIMISLVYFGFFILTQWLFLFPRRYWTTELKPQGRPMKRAAFAAGFAMMLISAGLIFAILDLLIGAMNIENQFWLIALMSVPLVLWLFWSVVFYRYWRHVDRYTWTGRIVRAVIAGSILELFVSVPTYVTREDDCYCARGSYCGIVFGLTALLWAFGPGVFLLFLREKQRQGKLLDSLENSST